MKLKLSRMIPCYQSCRNRDSSVFPSNPIPPFLRLSPSEVNNSSSSIIKRHHVFTFCSCISKSDVVITPAAAPPPPPTKRRDVFISEHDHTRSPPPPPPAVPEFHWEREEKWHVVAKILEDGDTDCTTTTTNTSSRRKIYNSSASDYCCDATFSPFNFDEKKKKKKQKQKQKRRSGKKKMIRIRISTSSAADEENEEEGSGLFTSEEEEEEEETENRRMFHKHKSYYHRSRKQTASSRRKELKLLEPGRKSGLGWCRAVEGKVRESYAVVKRSEDPREDFRRSMMEMIMEKEMFEQTELEELLVCFLSLNSSQHHSVIVQAFVDIWQALFVSTRRSSSCCSVSSSCVCNNGVSFAV